MLGLQETRSPGTSSAKTYSCVACSATFNSLASLLVHQASHASEVSDQKAATLPTCSHCGGLFASEDLLQKHHCMVLPLPVNQDVYTCDCGEEFHELSVLQEHKKLHENETQVEALLEETNNETSAINESSELAESDGSTSVPVKVPSVQNSPSYSTEESLQNPATISEDEKRDCISTSDSTPGQSTVSQKHCKEDLQPSDPSSPLTQTEAQDQGCDNVVESLKQENASVSDCEELPNESKESTNKKSLLEMLASAYMSCRQPAQMKCEQGKRSLPPRKVSPRAPMQSPTTISPSNSGCFIKQLRQKVAKYGPGGPNSEGFKKSGSMINVRPCKKKKKKRIVSTTRTLYPVVALETCQKLVRDDIEGKHQCGFCRRVFQDVDSLIMHHALHKKERVKFCRRCRQYLISVISVPINHICSANVGTAKHFPFVGKTVLMSDSPTAPHSQKLFQCSFCNRSYTRRHSLNKHNCQWIASLQQSSVAGDQNNDMASNLGELNNAEQQNSSCQKNIGVNTMGRNLVKTENHHEDPPLNEHHQKELQEEHPPLSSGVHLGSAKSFPPFLPHVSKVSPVQIRLKPRSAHEKVRQGSSTQGTESLERIQWTVPLDDAELDVMMEVDGKHDLVEAPKENSDDVVVLDPPLKSLTGLAWSSKDFQMHISGSGVKRFSCNRCQRSYSRRFTVKQHLKICGAGKLMDQHSFGKGNILALKKKFPCPNCGVAFTRKDNMNMHRKRCQLMRSTNSLLGNRISEKKIPASQDNMFVLPPVSTEQVRKESSKENSRSAGWGIMSLPSVLPRKVTCECGAAFTCPRLLFEHLQLHALESYICSHCGENLQSWADFEVHQKLHSATQPGQKNDQNGSQAQQPQGPSPLQQAPPFQSPKQSHKIQPPGLIKSHLNLRPLAEPCICHRCRKVFGRRKSLLRHLRVSCRGDLAIQKNNACSRCGMTFQSPLALKVHVQGNTCTPSFKPIRCPVCVRWFSCVEGLKRHLVSHSQQKVSTCHICGQKCSSHKDLEEHKRKVHGKKESLDSPTIQSAHVSQSDPSNAFRCQICQRSYPKLQSLKDHLRKVHRPQGLIPVGVGANALKAGGLQSSKGFVQQSQSKHFQCHMCSRTYPDFKSLKNHRRRVHRILGSGLPSKGPAQPSHSTPFQCHICSRSYPDLRSLRNHRRRVHRIIGGLEMFKGIVHQSQDNPYRCLICQRSYPDVRSLKNHRRRVHRILGDVPESAKVATLNIEQSEVKTEPIHFASSPSAAALVTATP